MLDLPFEVPIDPYMLYNGPGKEPGTVLVIQRMIYTFRICEYTDPDGYSRYWCYETFTGALAALLIYKESPDMEEPQGWTKSWDARRHG